MPSTPPCSTVRHSYILRNDDAGNAAPVITFNNGNPAALSVPENTTAVATITAVDPDLPSQALAYALSGADAQAFVIDPAGHLAFANAPDYEQPGDSGVNGVYDVIVTVSDGAGGSDSQAISVTVGNVNETPVSAPQDADGAVDTVAENAAIGTRVGVTAVALDADVSDVVRYTLTSNPGNLLAINSVTGIVSVAGAIDREATGPSVDIEVTATSSDGSTAASTFAIAIGDVDEFDVTSPVDTDAAPNSVAENAAAGTVVGVTALASDGDATNNIVSYRLTDSAGGRFEVDPQTGLLTVAAGAVLDFETATSHRVVVEAVSADGSLASQDFAIAVTNVNESAAITGTATGVVAEDGTLLAAGTLTVADPDTGESRFQTLAPAALRGVFGSFTFDTATGAWSYALNNTAANVQALNAGDVRHDTLTVTSLDGSATQVIDVTINGADETGTVITNGDAGGILYGTSGADVFRPDGGNDVVFAGAGNDTILATIGDGRDIYDGGAGIDTFDFSALTSGVTVALGGLALLSPVNTDVLISIENLIGGSGSDTITGNGVANRIEGRGGNDLLAGLLGDDTLDGGTGADTLEGGGGADRLIGGLGNDVMTGGAGQDAFVFGPGFGNDRITDFDANPAGGQDILDVSGLGITAALFASRVTIADVGADTLVTVDGTGSIRLAGVGNAATVTQQDFLLA